MPLDEIQPSTNQNSDSFQVSDPSENIILLDHVQGLLKSFTSVPSYTPQKFYQQIVPFNSSGNRRFFVWIENAWREGIVTTTGAAQGEVLYFNGNVWTRLAVGTAGQTLRTEGAAANPTWGFPSGLNISGQAQGDIIYFNGTNWVRLAAGTSGQFLQTSGAAANPAWASGLQRLGIATLATGASSLTLSGLAAREFLYVVIDVTGYSAADRPVMRFNSDSGANYAFRLWSDWVSSGGSGSDTSISITENALTTVPATIFISIHNRAAAPKRLYGNTSKTDSVSQPLTINFTGGWNNSVDAITSIGILTANLGNFNANTRIIAYGSTVT